MKADFNPSTCSAMPSVSKATTLIGDNPIDTEARSPASPMMPPNNRTSVFGTGA
jgi:hypothetical protein